MMKKFLIAMMAVMLMAPALFGAGESVHALLLPNQSITDQLADTSGATVYGLTDYVDMMAYKNVHGYVIHVGVSTWDSDMDSMTIVTQATAEPNVSTSWLTLDSQEVSSATSVSKYYAADSAYGMRYVRVIARVWGDPAGSGIVTTIAYAYLTMLDGLGQYAAMVGGRGKRIDFLQ